MAEDILQTPSQAAAQDPGRHPIPCDSPKQKGAARGDRGTKVCFAGLTSFPKQVDGHHVEHNMLNVVNLQFEGELEGQEEERCFRAGSTHVNSFSS